MDRQFMGPWVMSQRAVSGPRTPGGFQFRLTIGRRKVDGAWRTQHEHHSVLATD